MYFFQLLDTGSGSGNADSLHVRRSSLEDVLRRDLEPKPVPRSTELRRYNTVSYRGDPGDRGGAARRKAQKRSSRRLSMLNGHVFHSDVSYIHYANTL